MIDPEPEDGDLAAALAADPAPPPPALASIVARAIRRPQERPSPFAVLPKSVRLGWAASAAAALVLGCLTGGVTRTGALPGDVDTVFGAAPADLGGLALGR